MPPSLLNNLVHFESIIVFGIDTSEIELKMDAQRAFAHDSICNLASQHVRTHRRLTQR